MKNLSVVLLLLIFGDRLVAQPLTKATEYVDSFAVKTNFNGTILIARKGKPMFTKSYGFANMQFKVLNTADTKYKVASITKAFTSVLIMQLQEEGRIDLNKTISIYLPNYKGEGATKVTVQQLLTATSGIANIDEGLSLEGALKNGIPHYTLPRSTDDMLNLFSSGKLNKVPGKTFDYNNADFIILGKIIENVTGKSFEDNLKERILHPLNMANSGIAYQQPVIAKLANTYYFNDKGIYMNDLPVYIENWYASGNMYSTVDDILKFANGLFGRQLVKQASLDKMFISGLGEYGYGLWVYKNYDIHKKMYTIIKRPGSIMGAQAMLFHVLEDNTTIIILSNATSVGLDNVAAKIADRVLD
ncbi:MAG: serine hydrolase domain-containing protein [Bacteroidota bacterium]